MNRIRLFTLALGLSCAAGGVLAQTASQSIEVQGQAPVRTDVRQLCPGVDNEINDALVEAVRKIGAPAMMDVRFDLKGARVGDVQVGDGPLAYQRALRRAVRWLQCDSGEAAPQTVAFRVRVIDPYSRPVDRTAVAMALAPASAPAR